MELPELIIPRKPGAEDTEAMQNRVERLNRLYLEDGRDKPDHEKHGLYTGLSQQQEQGD